MEPVTPLGILYVVAAVLNQNRHQDCSSWRVERDMQGNGHVVVGQDRSKHSLAPMEAFDVAATYQEEAAAERAAA